MYLFGMKCIHYYKKFKCQAKQNRIVFVATAMTHRRFCSFACGMRIFQNATFSNLFMGHFFQKIYYLDINAQLIVMNNSSKNDFVNRKNFFFFFEATLGQGLVLSTLAVRERLASNGL